MSFLNSVLSSIGTGQPANPSPTLAATATAKSAAGKMAAANGSSAPQAPKRKASSDIVYASSKAPRKDGQINGTDRYTGTAKPSGTPPVSRPSSTGPDSLPYRGTAKGPPSTTTPRPMPKPVSKTTTVITSGTKSAAKAPSKPSTPSSAAPVSAPKPGSYAAMMARATQAQQGQTVVGAIKHKQTEKLTKKGLLAQKEEARKQALATKSKSATSIGRPGRLEGPSTKSGEPVKDKKKSVDLGYQGTMRAKPAEPSYTGTMRPGAPSKAQKKTQQSNDYRRPGEKVRNAGYSYYEDDEEDDYESDASSDMEAGAFDVDREEQQSLRFARKEDDEAKREEDEHRRQKMLRKQQMEKLAAQAAAKKKRY